MCHNKITLLAFLNCQKCYLNGQVILNFPTKVKMYFSILDGLMYGSYKQTFNKSLLELTYIYFQLSSVQGVSKCRYLFFLL